MRRSSKSHQDFAEFLENSYIGRHVNVEQILHDQLTLKKFLQLDRNSMRKYLKPTSSPQSVSESPDKQVESLAHHKESKIDFDTSDLENCSLRNTYHFCFSR